MTLPSGDVIEYLVDAMGRRVGKKINGALERQWLWRGKLQPVAEFDGSGNLLARLVYAGGVNVPELMVTPTATYRLVKDQLGSVRFVTNVATGAVVQEIRYDAWGRVLVDTNPGLQPFGFAGGLCDGETGLVRFGARDYDAETGRWTAKDLVRFAGGLNLFLYAHADPVNSSDYEGTMPPEEPLINYHWFHPNTHRLSRNWPGIHPEPTTYECCGAAADYWFLGKHCWVCAYPTPSTGICAGLTGGGFSTSIERDGEQYILDTYPDARCLLIEDVDTACVHDVLEEDSSSNDDRGPFMPWRNCVVYASQVLDECRY